MHGRIFEFEGFILDEGEQRLTKSGQLVQLSPKVFEVLTVLVENPRKLVTYEELMNSVWSDTFVEEGNLRFCIHSLRKALGTELIATVPKRGYRLEASVILRSGVRESLSGDVPIPSTEHVGMTEPPTHRLYRFAAVALLLICFLVTLALFALLSGDHTAAGQTPERTPSIALIPFQVIASDAPTAESIRNGLTQALAHDLGRIRGLRLIRPAGLEPFLGANAAPAAAAAQLNADEFLSGAFRVENGQARVTFRLIRAQDNSSPLDGSFTITETSIIEAEKASSLRIARAVDVHLMERKDERAIPPGLLDEETRVAYLLAQRIPRENDLNRWAEAASLMRRVVEKAPEWALGRAKLAEALVLTRGTKGCDEALESARAALELDASSAEAYLVIGVCHRWQNQWTRAERSFRKAIELNPGLDRAYLEYGQLLDFQRRFAEAEIHLKRALDLEPLTPFYNVVLCQHYYYDRKFTEALNYCERSRQIEPDYFLAMKRLYWIYVMQGRYDLVEEITFGKLSQEELLKNPLSRPLAEGDIRSYWEANLKERLANQSKRQSPVAIATYYVMLGDKSKALQHLEEAAASGSDQMNYIYPDPVFDPLRNEESFKALMQRLGVDKATFEHPVGRTSAPN